MKNRVEVINRNKRYGINGALIRKIAAHVLNGLREKEAALELVFLNDGAIKRLNKKFKNRDSATDVLSFRLEGAGFGLKGLFGEIFISLDAARRNSKIFKTKFEDEICRYVIHGILHLFGYDDTARAKKRRMAKKEDDILRRLCAKENLSRVLTPR